MLLEHNNEGMKVSIKQICQYKTFIIVGLECPKVHSEIYTEIGIYKKYFFFYIFFTSVCRGVETGVANLKKK